MLSSTNIQRASYSIRIQHLLIIKHHGTANFHQLKLTLISILSFLFAIILSSLIFNLS